MKLWEKCCLPLASMSAVALILHAPVVQFRLLDILWWIGLTPGR